MTINNLKICNCGFPVSLVCVLIKLFSSQLMYWWLHHLLSIIYQASMNCHGAGKGHRGEIGVWVQMLVKHFIKQQIRQQAKNRTENRVGHHRRQHSAGVLESREQND